MKTTLTLNSRLVQTTFGARTVLNESRSGVSLVDAQSLSRRTISLDRAVVIGEVKTALHIVADGQFVLTLSIGDTITTFTCDKVFIAYANFSSVTIAPVLPLDEDLTTAEVTAS